MNLTQLAEVGYLFRMHSYSLAFIKPIIVGIASLFLAKAATQICKPILSGPAWPLFAVLFGAIYILAILLVKFEKEDREFLKWIIEKIWQESPAPSTCSATLQSEQEKIGYTVYLHDVEQKYAEI